MGDTDKDKKSDLMATVALGVLSTLHDADLVRWLEVLSEQLKRGVADTMAVHKIVHPALSQDEVKTHFCRLAAECHRWVNDYPGLSHGDVIGMLVMVTAFVLEDEVRQLREPETPAPTSPPSSTVH